MAPPSAFPSRGPDLRDRPAVRWALGATLAAVPLCILCAVFCDVPVARWVDTLPPEARSLAEMASGFGLSGYMLLVSGLTAATCFTLVRRAKLRNHRRSALRRLGAQAFFVFSAVAVSGIVVQIVKHVVGRARPSLIDRLGPFHVDPFSLKASLASFPSGHVTSIVALAVALALLAPWTAMVAFPLALAVGAARIVLDAHYVSDALAGATLGAVTTLVLAAIFADRSVAFTRVTEAPQPRPARDLGLDLGIAAVKDGA